MPVEMCANVVDDDVTAAASECSSSSSPVVLLKYSCLWDYKLSGRCFSWHAGDTCHEAGRKSFPFLTTVRVTSTTSRLFSSASERAL